MKIRQQLANKSNYGSQRKMEEITYIVVHYTANDGDYDEGNANYFANNIVKASAHYFVDDDSVTQSVPDDYVAWSVGGSKYSDWAKTGGGKLYQIATNKNTLNIELCDTKKDGVIRAQEATLVNAIALIREKMQQYQIDIDHVIRHFDVNGKHCPVYFMDEQAWETFKARILGYDLGCKYRTLKACYLRTSAGMGNNKVRYSDLSAALQAKCSASDAAKIKSGKTFVLVGVCQVDDDIWGRIKSGYWLPLVYKDTCRAKKVK